jgi:uncharacterized protein with ATP-grasp and redox domains
MKTYYDCIPCFIKQALNAARFATDDTKIHEIVLRKVLSDVSKMDLHKTPPEMGALIHRIVKEVSGNEDPYKKVKSKFNQFALELYPKLAKIQNRSSNPLETAARIAIAGNIIDFGVGTDVDKTLVLKTIEQTLSDKLFGSVEQFKDAISNASKILYLGDNSGEIVFDRLLIDYLLSIKEPADHITFAVRGKPVINDITITDAEETGMTKIVNVIDNGSDIPGTVINKCSEEFQNYFNEADLVISKGQGNYETLSDVDKNIFFLLKVKCSVIANDIGCMIGTSVISVM